MNAFLYGVTAPNIGKNSWNVYWKDLGTQLKAKTVFTGKIYIHAPDFHDLRTIPDQTQAGFMHFDVNAARSAQDFQGVATPNPRKPNNQLLVHLQSTQMFSLLTSNNSLAPAHGACYSLLIKRNSQLMQLNTIFQKSLSGAYYINQEVGSRFFVPTYSIHVVVLCQHQNPSESLIVFSQLKLSPILDACIGIF